MVSLTVHRDQAVWEREHFEIEVPDDMDPADYDEYVNDLLASDNAPDSLSVEIINSVESMDTIVEIVQ